MRKSGFTIIELIMAVAISAILSTLAYSAWQGNLDKTRFKSLQEVSSRFALSQQRHRLTYSRYASSVIASGNSSSNTIVFEEAADYNVKVLNADFVTFSATFAPKSTTGLSELGLHCFQITVTSKQGFLSFTSADSKGQTNTDCLPNG